MRNNHVKRVVLIGLCLMFLLSISACKKDPYKDMTTEELEASIAAKKEAISDIQNSSSEPQLEIQDGWTHEYKDGYMYVKGRVKNTGTVDIGYFEISVKFKGSDGSVLDTDYTNSGQLLKVGNMEEFEIMHEFKKEYESVSVYVSKINAE